MNPGQRIRRGGCLTGRGFTLLEVLVAMAVLGLGLLMAFAASSGHTRLWAQATERQAAQALAQAKLLELMGSGRDALAEDIEPLRIGAWDAGYKVDIRPFELSRPEAAAELPLPARWEAVRIEVYWGPPDAVQRWSLSALRRQALPGAPG